MTITGSQIVAEAKKFAGYPYVYGAAGPKDFDCSGLVQFVLKGLGDSSVPRTSEQQWNWVQRISRNELQPGDLVFAQFPGDNASPGHVGFYMGNGQVLSAEDPALGVGYSSLNSWGTHIVGYGRPPQTATLTSAGGIPNPLSALGGLLSFPSQIISFFGDANTFVNKLMWLVNPASWLRIGAFLVGVVLLLFAIHAFIAVGEGKPIVSMPQVIPVPV